MKGAGAMQVKTKDFRHRIFMYSYIAGEDTEATYGDCSNEENCIRVLLSKGGTLRVNRDNIDDLNMSINMFSETDRGIISRALQIDNIEQNARRRLREGTGTESMIRMAVE